MTTRGFRELEAEQLANLIADVLDAPQDDGQPQPGRHRGKSPLQQVPCTRDEEERVPARSDYTY